MQKNSAYTKYFNHVLKDIRQNGQLDILKKRYTIAPKTYCKNLPKTNLALGYEKLTFLFVILIIGTVLSFFIFSCSVLFNEHERVQCLWLIWSGLTELSGAMTGAGLPGGFPNLNIISRGNSNINQPGRCGDTMQSGAQLVAGLVGRNVEVEGRG